MRSHDDASPGGVCAHAQLVQVVVGYTADVCPLLSGFESASELMYVHWSCIEQSLLAMAQWELTVGQTEQRMGLLSRLLTNRHAGLLTNRHV